MADAQQQQQQQQQEINIVDLPLDQLNTLKSQLEQELQQLTASFGGLREAQARFAESKEALQALSSKNKDKEVLVPLTSSMFVPGSLADVDEVLVDIGTGYFVQHSVANAKAFMDRKVEFLQTNTDSLKEVLENKRNMLEAVLMVMQQKLRVAQQQGGGAAQ